MRTIRIAVVGSGWVVTNRHLPALNTNDAFKITAIIGRQEQKLQKLAKKFKIPKYFTGDATKKREWLDLCDAVMIGTSPGSHYTVAKYCLQNGKHVLMEKPLTLAAKQSEELVALAKRKKLKFAIVHNFQFSRSAKQLDEDIPRLGKLRSIQAIQYGNPQRRLPTWYEDLPWGLFFDESPHLLYLLDKYAKGIKPINITKYESSTGLATPWSVVANFSTGTKIPATLYMNFEAPVSEWYLVLVGENRIGILDIFRDIYISIPNDKGHVAVDVIRTSRYAIQGHVIGTIRSGVKFLGGRYLCGNEEVVRIFADGIRKNTALHPIDASDGLRINRLQFEIMQRAQEIRR